MTDHANIDYENPNAQLAQAMEEARGIVRRLRQAEATLDVGLRGVARTVATLCEERQLLDAKLAGPLDALLEGLDRMIVAGTRRVSRTVLRGSGPDGDTYDDEIHIEMDKTVERLAPIRDALKLTRDRIERVRDIVAADHAMRALYDRRPSR